MDWRDLLDTLDSQDRERIERSLIRRSYEANEYIVRAQEPGDALYLIESGRVVVEGAAPTGQLVIFALLRRRLLR